jgi:hypothetical protein
MPFFGITVHCIIQKLKSKHLVCLSFLWEQFFLREQEKIFNTYSGPLTPFEAQQYTIEVNLSYTLYII